MFCGLFFLGSLLTLAQPALKSAEQSLKEAGTAFYNLDGEKSLRLSQKALDQAHDLNNDVLMSKAYNLIGLNIEEFYNPNKALKYYLKALEHAKLSQNDSVKIWVNNNLGNWYSYRKNDFQKSIPYYKEGLLHAEKINDWVEVMYAKLSIAGAYIGANHLKEGYAFLKSTEADVNRSEDDEPKLHFHSLCGTYFSHLGQNAQAEFHFKKAIQLGEKKKNNLLDAYLIEVYNDLSNHYKKIGSFEEALNYLTLHKDLKEKVYNEEQTKKVKLAGSQIEIDEYQREIDKIEGEKTKQSQDLKESKLIVLLFVIILFILLLLLFSLYKNNAFREKTFLELKEANAELQRAKERAEEASQLKTQFVSTISHELRTPLYGVVGITNIILDEHKELANSPHLNSLKFSARYLLSLVNDLLQINKIEENKITLEHMIFNIPDEISTIVDSLQFIAIKNNNQLQTELDPAIPEFLIGDKLRLSQVFMNLVSNALKFTKDGVVKVTAKLDRIEDTKYYIHFAVADTGVGIAPEDQQKIFEKFVQIERKEGDYQGTGLGLSIVQRLVELFGSQIELQSEVGKGTTFSFTMGFEADESKRNEILYNIDVDLSTVQVYRILVVEDNKINQVVTKKILETNHFKCTILDDGYAAIDALENEHYDIVLMDINMPIINGFETTKLIRKKGIQTPVIALTAFDKQEITEQAISVGINDIIIKPFEPSKLFQVISNLIEK
ncbi:MAG: Sensor histidine kinase RcsC [Bacteroidota bacterium]